MSPRVVPDGSEGVRVFVAVLLFSDRRCGFKRYQNTASDKFFIFRIIIITQEGCPAKLPYVLPHA